MKTSLEHIASQLKEIRNPSSYFRGTSPLSIEIPKTVLLFGRHHTNQLGPDPKHHHRFVLMISIIGEARVILDNQAFDFTAGNALLVFPHQFHHYFAAIPHPITWLFITFELSSSDTLSPIKNTALRLWPEVIDIVESIVRNYAANPNVTLRNNKTALLLAMLLNDLLSRAPVTMPAQEKSFSSQAHDTIDRVHRYVYAHIDHPVTITDIARHMALSSSHLRMLYRKSTGMSLGSYVRELRIRRAQELLQSSSMNISQIAYSCGFESIYAFSRAFRKKLEMSPSEYRKGRDSSEVRTQGVGSERT